MENDQASGGGSRLPRRVRGTPPRPASALPVLDPHRWVKEEQAYAGISPGLYRAPPRIICADCGCHRWTHINDGKYRYSLHGRSRSRIPGCQLPLPLLAALITASRPVRPDPHVAIIRAAELCEFHRAAGQFADARRYSRQAFALVQP